MATISAPIIPAKTAITTFRDAGYKNTASALAELIDNSIEAKAKDIQVFSMEKEIQKGNKTVPQIQEICVYDDGEGITSETLSFCLQFGNGTRMQSRKGMGRFGIGLPNASISQARRIEIYSWTEGGQCYFTYLDCDEIVEKDLHNVNAVTQNKLPTEYESVISGGLKNSGTFIIWKKCDRLDIKRTKTLFTHIEKDLCRIYRHYLDDDDTLGKKVKITLKGRGVQETDQCLKANDPLYLLKPNNVPGYENIATNIAHGEPIKISIEYAEGKTSIIEMRFSVALPGTQKLGGSSDVGQHYRKNVGISFVRQGREIDFGVFKFFRETEERERWWGCEVRFDPVLDELFGVTNNKQSIRGIYQINEKEFKQDNPDWQEILEEDYKMKLLMELSKHFKNNHKSIMNVVMSRGEGTGPKPTPDKSTKVANRKLEGETKKTKSNIEGEQKTEIEKEKEWEVRIKESDPTLTPTEIKEIVKEKKSYKIEKDFHSWPGGQFFSVEVTGGTCVVVMNRSHPFFTDLYEPMLKLNDDKFVNAIDLALMSYARMEDELYSRADDLDEIREVWGRHAKNFLLELRDEA
jgi:hypothetical protein